MNSLNNMSLAPAVAPPNTKLLDCKVFLSDIIENRGLLLSASSRSNLNAICLSDGQKLLVKDDEDEQVLGGTSKNAEGVVENKVGRARFERDEIKSQDDKSEVVEKIGESSDVVMKEEGEEEAKPKSEELKTEKTDETDSEAPQEQEVK